MKKKFYELKNISSSSADLFIYGEIVQEKTVDWWTGEESDTDVGLMDFKEQLDKIGNVKALNQYLNSPGRDVFTASSMISMLNRLKDKGTKIEAYVDGLSASASSFLMMVADNVNLYKNSTVMIHNPMSIAMGNAFDMQRTIDALNKIEDSVMMPMYMSKAKASEEKIKALIDAETWLNAKDMEKYFNVTLLDTEKLAVANIKSDLFKNYKLVPDYIKNFLEKEEKEEKTKKIEEKQENPQNNEDFLIGKNKKKELEIKARLGLVKGSLIMKNLKEKEGKNNE